MSRTAVCYLERVAGGTLFRRVRLVAQGGDGPAGAIDRTWAAPSLSGAAGGAGVGEGGAGSEAVNATRAAARWVADSLSQMGVRRLGYVCVDVDGSLCTWLSAPSADPDIINATLMQPDHDDGGTGAGGGGGAARLLALGASAGDGESGGFSPGDASVQALATLDRPGAGVGTKFGRRKSPAADSHRERYAVMAVPDAPVRVFMDELDARGVEVERVMSLWHAMAAAWDPGREAHRHDDDAGGLNGSGRVVASVSPASAILLVDPIGRLVWAWSQAGQLVAGGSMRLRTVERRHESSDETGADADGIARRVAGTGSGSGSGGGSHTGGPDAAEPTVVEFTEAESGRLVMDWLSWSAQLGHCPQRVACIGPAPATDAGAGVPDPALIGQSLGRNWPGAAIAVAVHADPVGATLLRLAGRGGTEPAGADGAAVGPDDPRASLIGLSARPGRADRGMYMWMAVGVAAAAVALVAIGWQLHRAGGSAESAIAAAAKARKDSLVSLEDVVKGVSLASANDARTALETRLDELKKQNAALRPAKPLLAEAARVFNAMDGHDGVKVTRIELNQVSGLVELRVPDAGAGPAILERLIASPGVVMKWQGVVPAGEPLEGERRYILTGLPQTLDPGRAGGGGGNS